MTVANEVEGSFWKSFFLKETEEKAIRNLCLEM
jgi:hypothetical protein